MNNIKPLRKKAGLTQEQVAQQMQVYQSRVSMWETGKNKPNAEMRQALAKILDCSTEDFYSKREIKVELDTNVLRRLRKKAGLTQKELAKRIGVCSGSVSNWERRKNTPRWYQLIEISEALGSSEDELAPLRGDDRDE